MSDLGSVLRRCAGFVAAVTFGALVFSRPAFSQSATYPRLADYMQGPAPLGEESLQQYLAKLDFSMVNIWPGWRGNGMTPEQVFAAIKARNPKTKIFVYIANNEIWDNSGPDDPFSELQNKVNSERWWLYLNGGAGPRVKATWDNNWIINTTEFSPRDASGRNFNEWYADWAVRQYITPNPLADGVLIDNFSWRPWTDGDWNRDGTTDVSLINGKPNAVATQWFQSGYKSFVARLRQQMRPGTMVLGNVNGFYQADMDGIDISAYDQLLNGGVFEGAMGETWSVERWSGWPALYRGYRFTMSRLAPPKLLIFEVRGRLDDYQFMRYSLATCLLDDAYFQYVDVEEKKRDVWFDEYDVELGAALSGPPAAAWSKGVYRRDFENGIVLVNPKGNGAVEVDLETEFRFIAGKQAPSVNTGQVTRKVRLSDRDGIILQRAAGVTRARPLPPQRVAVE